MQVKENPTYSATNETISKCCKGDLAYLYFSLLFLYLFYSFCSFLMSCVTLWTSCIPCSVQWICVSKCNVCAYKTTWMSGNDWREQAVSFPYWTRVAVPDFLQSEGSDCANEMCSMKCKQCEIERNEEQKQPQWTRLTGCHEIKELSRMKDNPRTVKKGTGTELQQEDCCY